MLTTDDVKEMILNLPSTLAAGWAVWFAVGLLLSVWARREKLMSDDYGYSEHKSGVRAAAASKPPSGVRAPRPSKNVPVSSGDAFGDLEKLLEPEAGSHRMPGEKSSPVLADIDRFIEGKDMQVTGSNGATLAAPQSLP